MSSPTITTQPQSQTIALGASVTFTVVATSTTTMTYQWYFNCEPISGATNSTYTDSSVVATDTGLYYVIITNTSGSTQSSNAFLTVSNVPLILEQPQSQTVNLGESAFFKVSAFSLSPLTYQWYLNGVAITGATLPTYLVCSATFDNVGTYYVIVSNSVGQTQSVNAILTVNGNAPIITKEPKSQQVEKNEKVKLCVKVCANSGNLSYQWYHNYKPIKCGYHSTLEIKHFTKCDQGDYYVIVSNQWGNTKSYTAELKICKK